MLFFRKFLKYRGVRRRERFSFLNSISVVGLLSVLFRNIFDVFGVKGLDLEEFVVYGSFYRKVGFLGILERLF